MLLLKALYHYAKTLSPDHDGSPEGAQPLTIVVSFSTTAGAGPFCMQVRGMRECPDRLRSQGGSVAHRLCALPQAMHARQTGINPISSKSWE